MNTHVYRIDKFIVPDEARDEFLSGVQRTHEFLRTLPGFVQDLVAEKVAGDGRYNIVTSVEWESQAAIDAAKTAVHSFHHEHRFDPAAFQRRLGVQSDLTSYKFIDGWRRT